jgi:glycosyltransferase involved in cell wall biosynthesis
MQIPARRLSESEKLIKGELRENAALIKKCDRLICVAQHSVDSFSQLNSLGKTPTIVVNNALYDSYRPLSDIERQVIRKRYYIDPATNIILFAGRIDKVKGVPALIQAFERVLQTHPDSRLLIAGDGLFNQCVNSMQSCWTKVSFTGKLDKERLYELYSIADVGVVCSLHEEFGYVAIEMMMHELPLIVTDTTGLAEIVINEETGLKVPIAKNEAGQREADIEIFSKQVNRLLSNREFARQLGVKGRERFLERYEIKLFGKKMRSIYHA